MTDLSRDQVRERLNELFRDVFDQPDLVLSDETTAADVPGWDSLNQIRLMLAYEGAFGVRIRQSEINKLSNVGELIDFLRATMLRS